MNGNDIIPTSNTHESTFVIIILVLVGYHDRRYTCILDNFIKTLDRGGFEQFPFRRLNCLTLYQLEYMSYITQLIRQ